MGPSTSTVPLFPTFLLPTFTLPFRRRGSATASRASAPDCKAYSAPSRVPSLSSSPTSTTSEPDPASPFDFGNLLYRADWDHRFEAATTKALPPNLHRPQPDRIRCSTCAADLAFGAQIVSKGFTGRHGRAFLVSPPSSLSTTPVDLGLTQQPYGLSKRDVDQLDDSELLNIKIGSRENRQLVTGAHVVADISCAMCGTKIGWKYVQATEQSQKYKEGKYILETQRVVAFRSWEDIENVPGVNASNSRADSATSRRTSYLRKSVDSENSSNVGKSEDDDPNQGIVFDSEDEEECEDIFAGTWDPAVVSKRRQKKVSRFKGKS